MVQPDWRVKLRPGQSSLKDFSCLFQSAARHGQVSQGIRQDDHEGPMLEPAPVFFNQIMRQMQVRPGFLPLTQQEARPAQDHMVIQFVGGPSILASIPE